jgi:chloramphenicol 3-O-phosphotransferase
MARGKIKYGRTGATNWYIDDVEVTKEEYDKRFPAKELGEPMAHAPSIWQDHTSDALAVHPDQVAEATARNRRHGISVTYDENGTAHIPDRAERKKLLRLEGMHDNGGGFGD